MRNVSFMTTHSILRLQITVITRYTFHTRGKKKTFLFRKDSLNQGTRACKCVRDVCICLVIERQTLQGYAAISF